MSGSLRNETESVVPEHLPSSSLPRLLLVFFGVLSPLLVFGALAEDVWSRETFDFDDVILNFLHGHATSGLDALMQLISGMGNVFLVLPLVALVSLALWLGRQRPQCGFLLFTTGGTCLLNLGAKLLFARDRPSLWHSIAPEYDYGFPSGHAMLSTAVVTALLLLLWHSHAPAAFKCAAAAAGVAYVLGVGLSRVYLGVHYPSDVLAGWCASLVWVSGVYVVLVRPRAGKVWRAKFMNST